jgi:predicted  nucleic acid-binding Zn-ribbon protein
LIHVLLTVENLYLEHVLNQADLSETQQDLVDMNQRYEMLEERLLDRQQELQGMLGSVKSFLQDLADILSWLDVKEKDLEGSVAIATSEKEAKRRLKEHEV